MSEDLARRTRDPDSYQEEDTLTGKFLTFHLAEVDYGVEIRHVTEIIGIQKITQVPDMPDFIRGVINLRGNVIPVMDVRTRFRLPDRDYDERTCIVVVNINDIAMGLVVDQVSEVAEIPENQIEPPPSSSIGNHSQYIQGMGKIDDQLKVLLDVTKLLRDEEQLAAQAVGAQEENISSEMEG